MLQREEFAKFMFALKKAVPFFAPEVDEAMVAVWYDSFKECDIDELRGAYVQLRERCEKFPSIQEIKAAMSMNNCFLDPVSEIKRMIRDTKSREMPQNLTEVMHTTLETFGGWWNVRNWTDKDFIDYAHLVRKAYKNALAMPKENLKKIPKLIAPPVAVTPEAKLEPVKPRNLLEELRMR